MKDRYRKKINSMIIFMTETSKGTYYIVSFLGSTHIVSRCLNSHVTCILFLPQKPLWSIIELGLFYIEVNMTEFSSQERLL